MLGRGGMGEVWLAQQRGSAGWQKQVAVKKLLPHLSQDAEFLARFHDEGRLAASLSHGNIVATLEMVEQDGETLVAMEYVDGIDLREALRRSRARGQTVPVDVALWVASEVCRALDFAHSRLGDDGRPLGIVHRDVSPSNVLLSRSGEVKLADFGIAAARSRLSRTLTGQLRGKLSYMSPEQASGLRVDGRSDLFALGAVVYEMLSGQKAFDGDAEAEILGRVQQARCTPLAELRPDLDPDLVATVERSMTLDPDARYATAEEMGVELLRSMMLQTGPVTQKRLARWLESLAHGAAASGARPGLDSALLAQLESSAERTGDGTGTRTASRPSGVSQHSAPRSGPVVVRVPVPDPSAPPFGPRRASGALLWGAPIIGAIALAGWFGWQARPVQGELVRIAAEPAGSDVFVDNTFVGISPLTVELAPGEHVVRVVEDGHAEHSERIVAGRGGERLLAVELAEVALPVTFESVPPGATVRVNSGAPFVAGNAVPVHPGEPLVVAMELEGYAALTQTVTLPEGVDVFTARLEPLDLPVADDAGPTATAGTPAAPIRVAVETPVDRSNNEATPDQQPAEPAEPGGLQLFFPAPPMVGSLTVDGQTVDLGDGQHPIELQPGAHRIEVRNAAFGVSHAAEVVIEPGQTTRHTVVWN